MDKFYLLCKTGLRSIFSDGEVTVLNLTTVTKSHVLEALSINEPGFSTELHSDARPLSVMLPLEYLPISSVLVRLPSVCGLEIYPCRKTECARPTCIHIHASDL